MDTLFICKKCDKPKAGAVDGKPRCGKKLYQKLAECEGLPFRIKPCKCLGKCKLGPNGLAMPGKHKLHTLSVKTVKEMARKKRPD